MEGDARTERIRELNDQFRRAIGIGRGGHYVMTDGVAALSPETIAMLWRWVRDFDDFTADNDPHGEHDFGAFEAGDLGRLFWKVDYYDSSLTYGSEDPADEAKTTRVLTLMLAHEY